MASYTAPNSYGGTAKYNPRIDLTSNDPRDIARGTRQGIYQQGQAMSSADQALADKYSGASQGTQDYLGNIESPLAEGHGGFNAAETSQIQMTPEEEQRIVTGAGISAGASTDAAVGAAQRATAATGGNPLAMAAYRARAAQQTGAQAGDAMTQARIAASNAAAQRAETIGGARIGQQNQALGYYGGLQSQQAGEAEAARGRQQQTYGTQTSGMNQAAQNSITASQTPGMFDKIMGAAGGAIQSGALKALADGDVPSGNQPAVVAEDGPEKIVQMGNTDYMADGDFLYGDAAPAMPAPSATPSFANLPTSAGYNAAMAAPTGSGTTTPNPDGSLTFNSGDQSAQPSWLQRFRDSLKNQAGPAAGQPQQQGSQQKAWNPVDTYKSIGQAAGALLGKFGDKGDDDSSGPNMADGGIATGKRDPYKHLLPHDSYQPMDQLPYGSSLPNDSYQPMGQQPYGSHLPDDSYQPMGQLPYKSSLPDDSYRPTMRQQEKPDYYADGGMGDIPDALRHPKPGFGHMPTAPQGTNGIFTKPTRVNLQPGEAAVPLSYRAGAKVRPSMAGLPAAKVSNHPYRAARV